MTRRRPSATDASTSGQAVQRVQFFHGVPGRNGTVTQLAEGSGSHTVTVRDAASRSASGSSYSAPHGGHTASPPPSRATSWRASAPSASATA